jgi:hypothetical protein
MALRPHALIPPGLVLGLLLIGVCAHAEPTAEPKAKPESPSSTDEARRKAGEIITQPARDVGVSKPEIPPVLAEAVKDPYSLAGLKTCRQLSAAVTALNAELGPVSAAGGVPP